MDSVACCRVEESSSNEDAVVVVTLRVSIPIIVNNFVCLPRARPFVMRSATISFVGQYSMLIVSFWHVVPDEMKLDVEMLRLCMIFCE